MTVISVVNIALGCLTILACLVELLLATSVLTNPLLGVAPTELHTALFTLVLSFTGIGIGSVAFIAGFGLRHSTPWSQDWTFAYAIAAVGISIFYGMIILAAPQGQTEAGTAGSLIIGVFGIVFYFLYPLVLLALLRSAKWQKAFLDGKRKFFLH